MRMRNRVCLNFEKKNRTYTLPNKPQTFKVITPTKNRTDVKQVRNECIFELNSNNNDRKHIFGIGTVADIKKGVDFDIVYMNFGKGFGISFLRKIICKTTNSRKQISILKKNQFCQVYGQCYYNEEYEEGSAMWRKSRQIYGLAFFPDYVPLAFDIERMGEDNERIEILKETDSDMKDAKDFLSVFERK